MFISNIFHAPIYDENGLAAPLSPAPSTETYEVCSTFSEAAVPRYCARTPYIVTTQVQASRAPRRVFGDRFRRHA